MLSSSAAGAGAALLTTSNRAPLLLLPRKPFPTTTARIAVAFDATAIAGVPLLRSAFSSWPGARAPARRRGCALICRDSSLQGPQGADPEAEEEEDKKKAEAVAAAAAARIAAAAAGGGGGGGSLGDWTTSVLLFGIWAGLMYYVFQLAPNQTPYRDTYFLQKLCNLKGDDGFRMNDVLVSLWYIMGLWPLVYSMLLLPTGRSSKGKIPVWPFLILSCFGGVYALIPYFVLWKPPPPPIDEEQIGQWPLKFLESKLTAGVTFSVGLGLIVYAAKAGGEDWQEFIRYFRESKLEKWLLALACGTDPFCGTFVVSFAATITLFSAGSNRTIRR
uniref:Cardiolipin synthase N-terminal domain-containing protein n=1 Tax=Leersia perrieri TaxID=77586 RepID=A0A0D9X6Y8_9ORYZ